MRDIPMKMVQFSFETHSDYYDIWQGYKLFHERQLRPHSEAIDAHACGCAGKTEIP